MTDRPGVPGDFERFFKSGSRVTFIARVSAALLAVRGAGGLAALVSDVGGDALLLAGRVGEALAVGGGVTVGVVPGVSA